ncbi:MAG: hypothetical protein JWN07_1175 [Hyphomicrobiales bacterium]|nr:hypothetical protein [Hyphomicrobiales bacterium]
MPRFFFDTKLQGQVFLDAEGMEFATREDALKQAFEDAASYAGDRLAHGVDLDHEVKSLRSETGEIVAEFTLLEALQRMTASPTEA